MGPISEHSAKFSPLHIQSRDDLGHALSALRLRANLTVRDLAARAKIPAATVSGYLKGRHLPSPSQMEQLRSILRECGVTGDDELSLWDEAVVRLRVVSDGRTGRRVSDADVPYLGLEPFQPGDADLFFGREAFVNLMVARIADLWRSRATAEQGLLRMLFVVGASGSGKSSLLRAGLYPAVVDGRADPGLDSEESSWVVAIMVPGDDPVAAMDAALEGTSEPRLLIIDQFEEIFSTDSGVEPTAFFGALSTLGPDTLVVAGLRADYYPDAASQTELVPSLQDWQMVVPPMSEAELRTVVTGPALARNVPVDDAVVEAVLAEALPAITAPATARMQALPLLSHALRAAWQHRSRNRLSLSDYRETGGLAGAVAKSAEEVYAELDTSEQELVRRIFLRLVNVDEELLVTRRRIRHEEFDALDDEHDGRASRVIERFVAQRLVILDQETVEVSHDALLTAWPRLAEWIAADRSGLRLHRRLTAGANSWRDGGDEATLLRGTALAAVEEWARDPDHFTAMNRVERGFLTASTAVRDAEARASQTRTRVLRRLLATTVTLLIVAVGSAVVAWHAGQVANNQRHTAVTERDEALSREVAIESSRAAATDPALAAQLALAAYRISPTLDARSALLDATSGGVVGRLVGPAGPTTLQLSPDGKVLAVSNAVDGSVALYQYVNDRLGARLGVVPAVRATHQVFALAWRPDGKLLAIGDSTGAVRVFDVGTPAHPVLAGQAPDPFALADEALAFSPDGGLLAAGGGQPTVRLWSVAEDGALTPHSPPAGTDTGDIAKQPVGQTITFNPDGTLLALGDSNGLVRTWDTAALDEPPHVWRGDRTTIDALAFSPDGGSIAVASKDFTAAVLSASLATAATLDTGFTSWINVAAYAPDGRYFALGGSDGKIDVFAAGGASPLLTYTAPSQVTGVAFSRDDSELLTVSADGTVRGWPVPGPQIRGGSAFGIGYNASGTLLATAGNQNDSSVTIWSTPSARQRELGAPPTATGTFSAPAAVGPLGGIAILSRDGRLIAAGTPTGDVLLSTLDGAGRPGPAQTLTGASGVIESVAFSPNGHILAAGADDGDVHLWDVSDSAAPQPLKPIVIGTQVDCIAISPDGRYLAAVGLDDHVDLYDISNPTVPRALASIGGFSGYTWSVAFSPDSTLMAVGAADNTVRVFSLAPPTKPKLVGKPFAGPAHYVFAVAFSPDGRTLAAAGGDGSVWTWAVSPAGTTQPLAVLYDADPGGSTYTVEFSPDGHTLAAGGSTGVTFWDTDADVAAADVCAYGGTPLSRAEWAQYVPDQPYANSCTPTQETTS